MPVSGGTTLKLVERALAPAQERVALLVALELALGVDAERVAGAEDVDLHRVVDDELGRHERLDLRRVAAEVGHRVAHRGEVDDAGHAGEVLHDHARGREGDLLRRLGLRVPRRERLDVLGADADAVLGAQEVLEQDLQGERQPRDVELRLQRVEAVDLVTCGRRPRARRGRRRSCQPCLQTTRGPATIPPRSRRPRARRPARQATVSGTVWPGRRIAIRPVRTSSESGAETGPRPGDQRLWPNVFGNTGVGRHAVAVAGQHAHVGQVHAHPPHGVVAQLAGEDPVAGQRVGREQQRLLGPRQRAEPAGRPRPSRRSPSAGRRPARRGAGLSRQRRDRDRADGRAAVAGAGPVPDPRPERRRWCRTSRPPARAAG